MVFQDDADREAFLQAVGEAWAKTGWEIHAYCLMPDHFHLLVGTPEPNLVSGMKWLLGTYTARHNRRHKLSGHLFAGRYRSLLLGPQGPYIKTAGEYVHLNPARARLIASTAPLASYPWSSFPHYTGAPVKDPPVWLKMEKLLREAGAGLDAELARDAFARGLETRRSLDLEAEFRLIRRGWCYGDDTFRRQMLGEVSRTAGTNHYGSELQEAATAKAAGIVDEELRAALWTEAELLRSRKGDPIKLAIAERLRSETTVTLQWIAARLNMGTKTHLSHLLYWSRRRGAPTTATRPSAAKPPRRQKGSTGNEVLGGEAYPAPLPPPPTVESHSNPTAGVEVLSLPVPDPFIFDTSFD